MRSSDLTTCKSCTERYCVTESTKLLSSDKTRTHVCNVRVPEIFGPLRNDGRFSLPNNLPIERGIGSSQTIAKARKELVAAGFWEVVETGTLYASGVFRWSDNWLNYNQKSLAKRKTLDPSAKAPGYCHHPNITS